ncbi:chlorophyll synthesis pathway protein BchC [Aestuariivirga litoralis]|uniref:Chlorophyll synthesis pathway protein BchC n=1 Tax=Aestuariivirga litoralis TaxID=2650924 RepID=A0A2W2AL05_9HYPH|nr:chlorophyll synthesis pathway protein BchC [Aestuariivirga litoralis]PZF76051.1 chlorophyll synthesis pathway protein BchC [Aestuariivirga litoralis]
METVAVVLERPSKLALRTVALQEPKADDLVVDAVWSGISSGTERLLWAGRMPSFPGMGYPLVPGYETVARVSQAADGFAEGDLVFVPGANCYKDVRGLFGGAAKRIVLPAARAVKLDGIADEEGILIALAATAHHAVAHALPQLIIGHGLLGRLIARITLALGGEAPTVLETQAARRDGAVGYTVTSPDQDTRRDYATICDASGAAGLLDQIIPKLRKQGEITLAGFYEEPLSFTFPPAFMREARIRIAAEFTMADMQAVKSLVSDGRLSLKGLISHHASAARAAEAYEQAFTDPSCIKMALDWSALA